MRKTLFKFPFLLRNPLGGHFSRFEFQAKFPFATFSRFRLKFPFSQISRFEFQAKFPFATFSRFEFQAKFPFAQISRFGLKREIKALGNLTRASIKAYAAAMPKREIWLKGNLGYICKY